MAEFAEGILNASIPYFWIAVYLSTFVVAYYGPWPTDIQRGMDAKESFVRSVRFGNMWVVKCMFVYVCFTFGLGVMVGDEDVKASMQNIGDWWLGMLSSHFLFLLLTLIAGLGFNFVIARFVWPSVSEFFYNLRRRQKTDEMPDVRASITKYKPIEYNPRDYYKDGHTLFGLEHGTKQPVLISNDKLMEAHFQIMGMSGSGKGRMAQKLCDQAILQGRPVIALDPKGDVRLRDAVYSACKETGREFIFFEMRGGYGGWHPFKNLSFEKICQAAGLMPGETDADYYKGLGRDILDDVLEKMDSANERASISALLRRIESLGDGEKEKASHIRTMLRGYRKFKQFNPQGAGLDIYRCIENGACIYVNTTTTGENRYIREIGKLFLMEVVQAIKDTHRLKKRDWMVELLVDEAKEMACTALLDAVTNIRSFGAHTSIMQQSVSDMAFVDSVKIDKRAMQKATSTSTPLKVMYCQEDPDDAEMAASRTGEIPIKIVRSERVSVNSAGAEEHSADGTTTGHTKTTLVTKNDFMHLPPGVAVVTLRTEYPRVISVAGIQAQHEFVYSTNQHVTAA